MITVLINHSLFTPQAEFKTGTYFTNTLTIYALYPGLMVTISESSPTKEVLIWNSALFGKRLCSLHFSLRKALYVTAESQANTWSFQCSPASTWIKTSGYSHCGWSHCAEAEEEHGFLLREPLTWSLFCLIDCLTCICSVLNKCFVGSCWAECFSFVSLVVLFSGPLKLLCLWTVSHCTSTTEETCVYQLRQLVCYDSCRHWLTRRPVAVQALATKSDRVFCSI